MSSRGLKYSLGMDREEFDAAERVVKATLLTTKRRGPFNNLVRVTQNIDDLSPGDQKYIAEWDSDSNGTLEGLCCWAGEGSYDFSIWLSPDLDPMSDLYRLSLLHELVHGYMNHADHDAKFRDMLGRVMYHFCDIVTPIYNVGFQVVMLNMRYTRPRKNEGDELLRRVIAAKEDIQTKAEIEYSSVLEMYERIS